METLAAWFAAITGLVVGVAAWRRVAAAQAEHDVAFRAVRALLAYRAWLARSHATAARVAKRMTVNYGGMLAGAVPVRDNFEEAVRPLVQARAEVELAWHEVSALWGDAAGGPIAKILGVTPTDVTFDVVQRVEDDHGPDSAIAFASAMKPLATWEPMFESAIAHYRLRLQDARGGLFHHVLKWIEDRRT